MTEPNNIRLKNEKKSRVHRINKFKNNCRHFIWYQIILYKYIDYSKYEVYLEENLTNLYKNP